MLGVHPLYNQAVPGVALWAILIKLTWYNYTWEICWALDGPPINAA